ncbi:MULTISPECIES: Clp protease N-terminal domain-containing protein [unclassified Streptomyces]|uniref:Clp protease N-terminal domain-containing protein n=1 Tax=unclassified Streptomyces TaxID=2593676 RepID=UPI00037D9318|nr:Clp protease N-terminal domain-containing protein [Streptomyces sp. HmicA12]
MQSPIPSDASACGLTGADPEDAPLSDELALVVAGAKRRAVRDGDRQVDSAHLLHSLLEADPDVRAAFADTGQVARLLGYLVQRSIGYGLRWQGALEDSGAVPVVRGAPGWSPVAAAAMEAGARRAASRGDERARGVDVLAALAAPDASEENRAVQVLRRAGVDVERLRQRLN